MCIERKDCEYGKKEKTIKIIVIIILIIIVLVVLCKRIRNVLQINMAQNEGSNVQSYNTNQIQDELTELELNNTVNNYETTVIENVVVPHIDTKTGAKYVTYEDFGAYADGVNDDYIPIRNAHIYANKNNYEVRTIEEKQYHIFRENEYMPIIVKTNTNWNNDTFILHDENIQNKQTKNYPIFQIMSYEEPKIIIDNEILKNIKVNTGITKIPQLSGNGKCLCIVYNDSKMQFIRYGGNANSGKKQQDIFRIDNEGDVLNEIQWNFDSISKIVLIPIPDTKLTIKNANFITVLPQNGEEQQSGYYNRNIACYRSNCEIQNINHLLNDGTLIGGPYYGSLKLVQVSDIRINDCKLTAHKYNKVSNYDLIVEYACNIEVNNVKQDNLEDNDRWGITGTNYTKDVIYKNCELNRIDAHSGVHNLTIEDSIVGIRDITVVESGKLNIENVTTLSPSTLVYLRDDYGSTWNGTINIKNCTMAKANNPKIVTFYTNYDNNNQPHNYGYDLYLPNIQLMD